MQRACNRTSLVLAQFWRVVTGTVADAGREIGGLEAGGTIAIRLDHMQEHNSNRPLSVDRGITVILDGGGNVLKWSNVATLFIVSAGASLCLVNAVLDGQMRGGRKGPVVLGVGSGTSLQFQDVTFQNCRGDWGALRLEGASAGFCTRCHFRGNVAKEGGAAVSGQGSGTQLHCKSCKFESNRVQKEGGAVNLQQGAQMTGEQCEFWGNFAQAGGALAAFDAQTQAKCLDCNFSKNIANAGGGAILLGTQLGIGSGSHGTYMEVTESTFKGNKALQQSGGGLVMGSASQMVFTDCQIEENMAPDGGAVSVLDISSYFR